MIKDYNSPELTKLLQSYFFDDLIFSAFCLFSWRHNRSVMNLALTVNQSIAQHVRQGERRIENYKDFEELYTLLKDMFPTSIWDDLIVSDFGEVKIKHNDEVYPIIIGNGYEQTYEASYFALNAGEVANKSEVLKEALNYFKQMISLLEKQNAVDDINEIVFELPSTVSTLKLRIKPF